MYAQAQCDGAAGAVSSAVKAHSRWLPCWWGHTASLGCVQRDSSLYLHQLGTDHVFRLPPPVHMTQLLMFCARATLCCAASGLNEWQPSHHVLNLKMS